MKKVLMVASTSSHILNFHMPYVYLLTNSGYEVHTLTETQIKNPSVNKSFEVPFTKKMTSVNNWAALKKSISILNNESYDLVITNTSLAGFIVRVAFLFSQTQSKLIHIAHGYLFGENCGIKDYIKYVIPEKMVSRVTDMLMVMNQEDYNLAKKYRLSKGSLAYVDGMGVDTNKFSKTDIATKNDLRDNYGIARDSRVFVYAAEFSVRKNQAFLIDVFSRLRLENVVLALVGDGDQWDYCKQIAHKLGVEKSVIFPGYSKKIEDWYRLSDCAVSSSKSEGLPFNIIEAMACGLPIIASDIKGHKELVDNELNGYLFSLDDVEGSIAIFSKVLCETDAFSSLGKAGILKAQQFSIEAVQESIFEIYKSYL